MSNWSFFAVLLRADRLLATAWWLALALRGVLPALFAIAMGALVGAVSRGDPTGTPLAAVGAVFLLLQVLGPLHQAIGANLGSRTATWLYDQLTLSCVRPPGMGHLEDPGLTTDLAVARDFDLGITGPPLFIAMDFIAAGLVEMIGGIAASLVLFGYGWWAPPLLAGAWLGTHWLLKESAVWRDRNTDQVRAAQRQADYAYRLAVEPPAAKEIRLFGLAAWTVDRFRDARRLLLDLQYEATRLRERPVLWSLLLVLSANVLLFYLMASDALAGRLALSQVVTFAGAAIASSSIAFGGLSWALDQGAAPVNAVLKLQTAMPASGALRSGNRPAAGLPAGEIRFRGVQFTYPNTDQRVLDGFDLTIPVGSSLAIVGQNGAGKTTVAKLQAAVATIAHHEHPEYIDRLGMLRNQVFVLDHIYMSLFTTCGWLLRLSVTLALLATVHPALVLLALFAVPTVASSTWRPRIERATEEGAARQSRLARHLFTTATTAPPGKEVRVTRIGEQLLQRRREAFERWYRPISRARWTTALFHTAAWAVFGVAYVAAVVFVSQRPGATAGQVLLVLAAGARLSAYVAATVGELGFLTGFWLDGSRRLAWLEDYAASVSEHADQPAPARISEGIRFEGVSFTYPGTQRRVLEDVNLELKPGSVVAVVGENGAGKSTLVKILCRMYQPDAGRILVDGRDLEQIGVEKWRSKLAGAFQDFFKFELKAKHSVGLGDVPRMEQQSASVTRVGCGLRGIILRPRSGGGTPGTPSGASAGRRGRFRRLPRTGWRWLVSGETSGGKRPARRTLRIGLWVAGVLVVGLAAVTAAVHKLVDPALLKVRIEREASAALGRPVTVGSVAAGWGAAIVVENLAVMDAARRAPVASIERARVSVSLAGLLGGQVRLSGCALEGVTLRLARNAAGEWDGADVAARLAGGAAAAPSSSGGPGEVSISGLSIDLTDASGRGPARIRLVEAGGSIAGTGPISFHLQGAVEGAPVPVKGSTDAVAPRLAREVGIEGRFDPARSTGSAKLVARGLALALADRWLPPGAALPVRAQAGEADLTLVAGIAAGPTLPVLEGTLELARARVALPGAARTLDAIAGRIAFDRSRIRVERLSADLSESGAGARVRALSLSAAAATLAPDGFTCPEAKIDIDGVALSASLSVSGLPVSPRFQARLASPAADVSRLSPSLAGTLPVDVVITGTPSDPSLAGKLPLAGLKLTLPRSLGGLTVQVRSGALALSGSDLLASDLLVVAAGAEISPRLAVSGVFGTPTIAFDSGDFEIDLAHLPSLVDREVAVSVASVALQGKVQLVLKAVGPIAAPRLAGRIRPVGTSFAIPGTARRVSIAQGQVDVSGNHALVSGVKLLADGLEVVVSGAVADPASERRRVSLDVAGRDVVLARLLPFLPAPAAAAVEALGLAGKIDFDALVAGPPGALRADLLVALKGVRAVLPYRDRRFTAEFGGGTLEVSPDAVRARGVEGSVEGVALVVGGTVRDYASAEPALDLKVLARGVTLDKLRGLAPDDVLAAANRRRCALTFDARAGLTGTRGKPAYALSIVPQSGSCVVPFGDRTLPVTILGGGELSVSGQNLVLAGLGASFEGNACRISGTVRDFAGAAHLDLKVQGEALDLARLARHVGGAAQAALAGSGFTGGRGVRASIKGTASDPRVEPEIDLSGAEFRSLAGIGPGRIARGSLSVSGQTVTLEDVVVELAGSPIAVKGSVVPGRGVKLCFKGDAVALGPLVAGLALPPGTAVGGTTRVDVCAEGPIEAPRLTGRVGLAGISVRSDDLPAPVTGESGEIVLAGEDLLLADGAFRLGAAPFTARGKIAGFRGDGRWEELALAGRFDLAEVAGRTGVRLSGAGTFEARGHGPMKNPVLEGTMAIRSAELASGVRIANLNGQFKRSASELAIPQIAGELAGGRLSATISVNSSTSPARTVVSVRVQSADLAALLASAGRRSGEVSLAGKLDAALNDATAAGSLASLAGSGSVKLDGLTVDLSRSRDIARRLQQTAGAEAIAGLAATILRKDRRGRELSGAAGEEAAFYRSVLDELRRSRNVGTVSAPVALSGGVLKLAPLSGQNVSGGIAVDLSTHALSGTITTLTLGRVGIHQVQLGGTLDDPRPRYDIRKITLDGKPPPVARAREDAPAAGAAETAGTDIERITGQLLGARKRTPAPAREADGEEPEPAAEAPDADAAPPAPVASPAPEPRRRLPKDAQKAVDMFNSLFRRKKK
jgi:ABC-type multidrug transport system fused ATPase/permease subunit